MCVFVFTNKCDTADEFHCCGAHSWTEMGSTTFMKSSVASCGFFSDGILKWSRGPATISVFTLRSADVCVFVFTNKCDTADEFHCCGAHSWTEMGSTAF